MSLPLRLGLFYAAIFVGSGASSPYMPLWFAERGLNGAQIGLILSLPLLVRIVTAPLLAIWADSFRLRRTAILLLSLAVAVSYGLLALPLGFTGWMVVWFAASSAISSVAPLTDVIALNHARRAGFNFGWPRGIGSAAFIVGNIGMGAVLAWGTPDLVLVWITMAAMLMAVAARFLLPADPVHEDGEKRAAGARFAGLGELLRDKGFMTAVVAAGLIQSAHAFYYGFSTLAWRDQGIAPGLTGVLWGVGVAVEIAFLWWMEPWRRRIGPTNLLILGGIASLVRWTGLALSPPLWVIFALQTLHVFSYAATFLASLEIIGRLSKPANASAAQSLNSALSGGILMGLATLASGPLYDGFGAYGYLLMSAMCGLGLIAALRLRYDADVATRLRG
ncbi:MFS transporter [Phenylobacterium sp.]|jgi:PPP family 3-phenylpropionic acid transporter|uniref:MFS transporter n=1 Tax=Phenylobacterium sp. TaxID=1871053 RepID=UPI0037C882A1